jgi:hypothetical protein
MHTLLPQDRRDVRLALIPFFLGLALGAMLVSCFPRTLVFQNDEPGGLSYGYGNSSSFAPPTEFNCHDRVDNDSDGLVDCEDKEDCNLSNDCKEICDNHLDDDGDLDIDCDDGWCTNDPACL